MVGHMNPMKRRAFLQLEAIAAMCMMIFVIGAFAVAVLGLARSSHKMIARQQATLAAEAVLNEIRCGETPTQDELAERFVDMTIRIDRAAASGDFEGFDRATVSVDCFVHGRHAASVHLSGVVRKEKVE